MPRGSPALEVKVKHEAIQVAFPSLISDTKPTVPTLSCSER